MTAVYGTASVPCGGRPVLTGAVRPARAFSAVGREEDSFSPHFCRCRPATAGIGHSTDRIRHRFAPSEGWFHIRPTRFRCGEVLFRGACVRGYQAPAAVLRSDVMFPAFRVSPFRRVRLFSVPVLGFTAPLLSSYLPTWTETVRVKKIIPGFLRQNSQKSRNDQKISENSKKYDKNPACPETRIPHSPCRPA